MIAPAALRTSLAHRRAARRERAGDATGAARLLRRAAGGAQDASAVLLLAFADETELRNGIVPDDLDATRTALARQADEALRTGSDPSALLTRLAVLTFHRLVHLDRPSSPLAADPAAHLAPLRTSSAWARLVAPRQHPPAQGDLGRRGRLVPAGTARRRVCVVTDGDRRFLDPLLPHLGPDVDVDVVSLRDWSGPQLPLTPAEQVTARLDPGVGTRPWAVALEERIGDADVVWVEWCQRAAVLVTQLSLSGRPVMVRLHSFEAFTVFPHLVDPSRVDALVVVSPAMAALVEAVVPTLRDRLHVLPNAIDPGPFAGRPKVPAAEHTLGVVGWGAPAKDVCWALDVLAELRRHDSRWGLRLVGPPPDGRTAGSRAYAASVQERISHPDVAGAVEVVGASEDVPGELTRIGALVSSSTRESFHLAVGEAAASGARVVVRDWPTLAPYGGPHGTWPDDWVVTTPQEAARALLSGAAPTPAPDHAPSTVGPLYRALLDSLGGDAPGVRPPGSPPAAQ